MEPESRRSFIKKPGVIVAGLMSLAVVGGTTIAMLQPSPSIDSRSATTGQIPTTQASANPSKVSSSKLSQRPTVTDPSSDSTASPAPDREASTSLEASNEPAASRANDSGSNASTSAAATDSSNGSTPKTPESLRLVESCETTMAQINDPNPPANVRSQPNTGGNSSDSPIVGNLKNGTFITIVDQRDNWFRISTPMKGWVAKNITLSGCNQKEERVKFANNRNDTTISDEFIGTGSHVYKLYLLKGQTLTLTAQKGPRPTVISPSGKTLVTSSDQATSWSGKLPESGNYQITLESNFKGYNYAFEVVAK
jgi:hypothetical protein